MHSSVSFPHCYSLLTYSVFGYKKKKDANLFCGNILEAICFILAMRFFNAGCTKANTMFDYKGSDDADEVAPGTETAPGTESSVTAQVGNNLVSCAFAWPVTF